MLEGKCIVIIGGTTGIGSSAAISFLNHGARVVVTGTAGIRESQERLGEAAVVMESDARTEGSAEEAIAACVSTFGGFHGLYHVAGGSGRKFGDRKSTRLNSSH